MSRKSSKSNRPITDFFRPNPSKLSKASSSLPTTHGHSESLTISSSQIKATQGSKRIEYKGHEFVRGSDEDTDDSLEDLDVILQSMRSSAAPKPKPLPEHLLKHEPQKKKWKYSFDALLKQTEDLQDRNARIKDMDAKLKEDGTASYLSSEKGLVPTEALLASALPNEKNDDKKMDKVQRVAQAIQRTEALEYEYIFHFFEETSPTDQSTFPKDISSNNGWLKSFIGLLFSCLLSLKNADKLH
jgi:hypothetical protein